MVSGARKRIRRGMECIEAVDLAEAARKPVGEYSHGMQKRLSVARALLMDPAIMLVDEATHDLDLQASRRIQDLIADRARKGAAVVWATQRIDEIRAFAHTVTLLNRGRVRFEGTVPQLMATTFAHRYLLHLDLSQTTVADLLVRRARPSDGEAISTRVVVLRPSTIY